MKRITVLLLVLSMLLSVSSFTLAESSKDETNEKGLEFGIYEIVDDKNQIVRVYEKKITTPHQEQFTTKIYSEDQYSEIKEILLTLGMEQDFIDNLSENDLKLYESSEMLIGTITYTKTDAQDNVTYIEESVAIQEAKAINDLQIEENARLHNAMDMNIDSQYSQNSIVQRKYEDSYMRLYHLVSYFGDGSYLFSTDARWLTMPFFRGKDSIGSCAQNATITDGSQSGYYEYDYTTFNGITSTSGTERRNISSSKFKNAIQGSFFGSAAIIDLPNDTMTQYSSSVFNNYKAHFQYFGHVTSPNEERYFNSIGTYDHAKVALSFTPSVSIGFDGPSASIGLDIHGATEERSALIEVHYIPSN